MVAFVMVIMMVTIIDGTDHHEDDDDAAAQSASRRLFAGLFVCLVHGCLHVRRDEFSRRFNVGLDARASKAFI